MKTFHEDDIEVLGADMKSPAQPALQPARRKRWLWLIAAAMGVAGIALLTLVFLKRSADPIDEVPPSEITAQPVQPVRESFVTAISDSINDVPFTLFSVDSLKVEVSFRQPDTTDTDVLLATPAADIRADNGQIVGEFIAHREQLACGTRKAGYCYIAPEGGISIGAGEAGAAKAQALERGGWFFRQYALVMDGEVQPNMLRGKARRRALGFLNGKPVMVLSKERESVYDFAQALADYGFSHVLYLPGGDSFLLLRTDGRIIFQDTWKEVPPTANYLVFRSK